MERDYAVAVVTLLCCMPILGMGMQVARTHRKTGILAPAMSPNFYRASLAGWQRAPDLNFGHPDRTIRVSRTSLGCRWQVSP